MKTKSSYHLAVLTVVAMTLLFGVADGHPPDRPYAAFGNSTGDRQMLEYIRAGEGTRLAVLVRHDDTERGYAYSPAEGFPDTKVGTFTQALYDQAKADGWIVISMKKDRKNMFSFQ